MTLQQFIKKRPYLVWSTKNYERLNNEAIIEAVLNYGNWEDFKKIIKILGLKKIAQIFRKEIMQKRCNYRPEVKNYFKLYFNKYAQ